MANFLKEIEEAGKDKKLIFDEDHFNKFLKEDKDKNENGGDAMRGTQ